MTTLLHRRYGNGQELVGALRQLQLNTLFGTPNQCVFQAFSDVVKVLVADSLARFWVGNNMVVSETE